MRHIFKITITLFILPYFSQHGQTAMDKAANDEIRAIVRTYDTQQQLQATKVALAQVQKELEDTKHRLENELESTRRELNDLKVL